MRALVLETKMRASPSWWRSQTECVTLAARRQHQGAADAQPPHSIAGAAFRSEEIQTYTEGREKKGSTTVWGVGGGWYRCAPATCWNGPNIFTGLFYNHRHKKMHYFHRKTRGFLFLLRRSILESPPNCFDQHFQLIELKNHNIIAHREIYTYGQEGF